jgi:hypothetical protein
MFIQLTYICLGNEIEDIMEGSARIEETRNVYRNFVGKANILDKNG